MYRSLKFDSKLTKSTRFFPLFGKLGRVVHDIPANCGHGGQRAIWRRGDVMAYICSLVG